MRRVVERSRDQQSGLADVRQVVLAQRYDTSRLLTLDRRSFDVVRPIGGGRITFVPR